jgi:hypothetical protein
MSTRHDLMAKGLRMVCYAWATPGALAIWAIDLWAERVRADLLRRRDARLDAAQRIAGRTGLAVEAAFHALDRRTEEDVLEEWRKIVTEDRS